MNQPLSLMLRLTAACATATLLAACSMGGLFGGGNAAQNQQLQNATATPAAVAEAQSSALPAIATQCPPIRIRPGSEAMFYYGNGELAEALGLAKDMSGSGMGKRFTRSAMLIRNGIVDAVFVEDAPGVNASGAPAILMALEAARS